MGWTIAFITVFVLMLTLYISSNQTSVVKSTMTLDWDSIMKSIAPKLEEVLIEYDHPKMIQSSNFAELLMLDLIGLFAFHTHVQALHSFGSGSLSTSNIQLMKTLEISKRRGKTNKLLWYFYGLGDGSLDVLNNRAFLRRLVHTYLKQRDRTEGKYSSALIQYASDVSNTAVLDERMASLVSDCTQVFLALMSLSSVLQSLLREISSVPTSLDEVGLIEIINGHFQTSQEKEILANNHRNRFLLVICEAIFKKFKMQGDFIIKRE